MKLVLNNGAEYAPDDVHESCFPSGMETSGLVVSFTDALEIDELKAAFSEDGALDEVTLYGDDGAVAARFTKYKYLSSIRVAYNSAVFYRTVVVLCAEQRSKSV